MSVLDTVLSDVAKVARLIEPAFAVIAIAQQVTGLGGESAAMGIKVLDAAVKALEQAARGAITHDEVMAELAKLSAGLRSNDDAADTALNARFPA